jgi:hypothetical protein
MEVAMTRLKALPALRLAACLTVGVLTSVGTNVLASGLKICVPQKEGAAVVTQKGGTCKANYTATSLLPEPEQQTLQTILPYIKYFASGVGGKPTVEFSGVNLQVVNGEGKTGSLNGTGNLVIGYDENPGKHEQTGSHDLILGQEQTFTSFGSILGGLGNTDSGSGSFVVGEGNTTSGAGASVSGGKGNHAQSGDSVSGGSGNTAENATGNFSSVSGGSGNTAAGQDSSVSGGGGNRANWINTAISGGEGNSAGNMGDSVSGGRHNYADGGGRAFGEDPGGASVSGGEYNNAFQIGSSISGGEYNETEGCWSWAGGGYKNKSGITESFCEGGPFTSIFGGKELSATHAYQAIP